MCAATRVSRVSSEARISTAIPRHENGEANPSPSGPRRPWALVCLFLWVANNRSDGNLAGMSDEDVEIAAGWSFEPGNFVPALADVGFSRWWPQIPKHSSVG